MNKRMILISAIVLAAVTVLVIAFLWLVYPQLRLDFYQKKADERIAQVERGEIDYLEASYTWEDRGCDPYGSFCVMLEANRVLDTDTRYTLWVDMYECTKAAASDEWSCYLH